MDIVAKALEIAENAHKGQVDKAGIESSQVCGKFSF